MRERQAKIHINIKRQQDNNNKTPKKEKKRQTKLEEVERLR